MNKMMAATAAALLSVSLLTACSDGAGRGESASSDSATVAATTAAAKEQGGIPKAAVGEQVDPQVFVKVLEDASKKYPYQDMSLTEDVVGTDASINMTMDAKFDNADPAKPRFAGTMHTTGRSAAVDQPLEAVIDMAYDGDVLWARISANGVNGEWEQTDQDQTGISDVLKMSGFTAGAAPASVVFDGERDGLRFYRLDGMSAPGSVSYDSVLVGVDDNGLMRHMELSGATNMNQQAMTVNLTLTSTPLDSAPDVSKESLG